MERQVVWWGLLLALVVAAGSESICRRTGECESPGCRCSDSGTPGGLDPDTVPQMVIFTFDSSVNSLVYKFYERLFSRDRRNPNGCSVKMTVFVPHVNTNYKMVKSLAERDMEIGAQGVAPSAPRSYWKNITYEKMSGEIRQQLDNLENKAGIPREEIRGWRNPGLQPSGDIQFGWLQNFTFEYDSSLSVTKRSLDATNTWPYTLDYGWDRQCHVKPCPRGRYPGLWEVPVVSLVDPVRPGPCGGSHVDSCIPFCKQAAVNLLWKNFLSHYQRDKAPFLVNMQALWFLRDPELLDAVDEFMTTLLTYDDVYFVTIHQALQWMRNPVPKSRVSEFAPWQCSSPVLRNTSLPRYLAPSIVEPPCDSPYTRPVLTMDLPPCRQGNNCLEPTCRCSRTGPPSGVPVTDIPQMVIVTYDGTVTGTSSKVYSQLFNSELKNPNGCAITMTMFVHDLETDYKLVKNWYLRRMEIGVHSVSVKSPSSYWATLTEKEMYFEIVGQRNFIVDKTGIPESEIRGWRSPFLQPSGDRQFKVLYENDFEYDSTLTMTKRTLDFINRWPFTMDYGWDITCEIPPCPVLNYTGFWQVPIVSLVNASSSKPCHGPYVDSCLTTDKQEAYNLLLSNFDSHYNRRRAPFMINLQMSWLMVKHNFDAMKEFFSTILSRGDVYIMSIHQALAWMKNPTPLSAMNSFEPWQCSSELPLIASTTTTNTPVTKTTTTAANAKTTVRSTTTPSTTTTTIVPALNRRLKTAQSVAIQTPATTTPTRAYATKTTLTPTTTTPAPTFSMTPASNTWTTPKSTTTTTPKTTTTMTTATPVPTTTKRTPTPTTTTISATTPTSTTTTTTTTPTPTTTTSTTTPTPTTTTTTTTLRTSTTTTTTPRTSTTTLRPTTAIPPRPTRTTLTPTLITRTPTFTRSTTITPVPVTALPSTTRTLGSINVEKSQQTTKTSHMYSTQWKVTLDAASLVTALPNTTAQNVMGGFNRRQSYPWNMSTSSVFASRLPTGRPLAHYPSQFYLGPTKLPRDKLSSEINTTHSYPEKPPDSSNTSQTGKSSNLNTSRTGKSSNPNTSQTGKSSDPNPSQTGKSSNPNSPSQTQQPSEPNNPPQNGQQLDPNNPSLNDQPPDPKNTPQSGKPSDSNNSSQIGPPYDPNKPPQTQQQPDSNKQAQTGQLPDPNNTFQTGQPSGRNNSSQAGPPSDPNKPPQTQQQPDSENQAETGQTPDPSNPSQTGQPTDPNNTFQTGQPSDRTSSSQTGQAFDPNDPRLSGSQSNPNNPRKSGQPSDSHNPRQLGQPSNPNNPRQSEQPSDPNNPRLSAQPSDPKNPRQSGQPSDPNSLQQSGQPSDPNNSRQSGQSSDPNNPRQSGQPSDPNNPRQSGQPSDPNNPQQSGQPSDPNNPRQSGQPSDPNNPQQSGQPSDPNNSRQSGQSSDPNNPQQSGQPSDPNNPRQSGQPSDPNNPQQSGQPSDPHNPRRSGQLFDRNNSSQTGPPTDHSNPPQTRRPFYPNYRPQTGQTSDLKNSTQTGHGSNPNNPRQNRPDPNHRSQTEQTYSTNNSTKTGQPSKPDNPRQSEEPSGPNNPRQSGQPSDPNNPRQSGQPSDPNNPRKSGQPSDPNNPRQSGQAADRNNTDQAGQPSYPSNKQQTGQTSDLDGTTQAGQASNPNNPTQNGQPSDPNNSVQVGQPSVSSDQSISKQPSSKGSQSEDEQSKPSQAENKKNSNLQKDTSKTIPSDQPSVESTSRPEVNAVLLEQTPVVIQPSRGGCANPNGRLVTILVIWTLCAVFRLFMP